MKVDRFQHHDADGDGSVTPEEMAAPADRMERMQMMRSNMEDAPARPGNGQGMGNGSMMQDNGANGCRFFSGTRPHNPKTIRGRDIEPNRDLNRLASVCQQIETRKGKFPWPIPMIAS